MERLLVKNIGTLVIDAQGKPCVCGEEMGRLDCINNAWLLTEDGRFKDWGGDDTSPSPSEGLC